MHVSQAWFWLIDKQKILKMSNVQTLSIYDACPLKSKPKQRVQTNVTKVLHKHKTSLSGPQLQLIGNQKGLCIHLGQRTRKNEKKKKCKNNLAGVWGVLWCVGCKNRNQDEFGEADLVGDGCEIHSAPWLLLSHQTHSLGSHICVWMCLNVPPVALTCSA